MASALKFTVGADVGPFIKEMRQIEAQAALAGLRVQKAVRQSTVENAFKPHDAREEYANWWKQQGDMGKLGGSNAGKGWLIGFFQNLKGQGSGGISQLVSVVSNTLSSLGSGISPMRILAQQGPNIAQAFVSIGGSLLRFITIASGAVAILGALGLAAYKVHQYFKNLRDSIVDAGNRFGLARPSVEQLNQAMKDGADVAADYNKWLRSLSGSTMSLADRTEHLIKRMREQFDLERKIAEQRGATKPELAEMDKKQLQREIDLVNAQREAAYEKRNIHLQEAKDAAETLQKQIEQDAATIGIAGTKNARMAKVADAIKKELGIDKLEGQSASDTFTRMRMVAGAEGELVPEIIQSTVGEEIARLSNQIGNFTVDGENYRGSLKDAEREMRGAAQVEKDLKEVQAKLKETLSKKEQLTEEDRKTIQALGKKETELINAQNLLNDPRQALLFAQVNASSGRKSIGMSEWERAGAFMGGPQIAMLDVGKAQLKELKDINRKVGKGRGVDFGD